MDFFIKSAPFGDCAGCLKAEGKHQVFDRFSRPIAAIPALGLPAIEGVYVYLCDACFARRNANTNSQSNNEENYRG